MSFSLPTVYKESFLHIAVIVLIWYIIIYTFTLKRDNEKLNSEKKQPKFGKKLSHVQVIALGFLIIILTGTLLLMLPVSSADKKSAPFETAFFTAVSSSCVTGLVMRDTATGWSGFGQAVILTLIQIGGLGFMTIATFAFRITQRKMGLRSREIMLESINNSNIRGIMDFSREIIVRTIILELTGATLLSSVYIPELGIGKGIWYGVFHAVSAFCNAGFDLMGYVAPYDSFVSLKGNILVNVVITVLIILGGLGFFVWHDIISSGFRWKKFKVQTKIVIVVSAVLIFGGAAFFYLLERSSTGAGLSEKERILTALFASVTARTAGFNTVDIPSMSSGSKLLTIILMVIGGSPGSTAGGVKTTSVAVITLGTFSHFRGEKKPSVFKRSISRETYLKSCSVLFYSVGLALTATMIISALQPDLDLTDILFETFSAIGTVGMTTGITRLLCPASAYITAMLMFMGRVGSVSFATALLEKKANPRVQYPEEDINVG